jgi:hypothetical protein
MSVFSKPKSGVTGVTILKNRGLTLVNTGVSRCHTGVTLVSHSVTPLFLFCITVVNSLYLKYYSFFSKSSVTLV